jgi:hypothetical protein
MDVVEQRESELFRALGGLSPAERGALITRLCSAFGVYPKSPKGTIRSPTPSQKPKVTASQKPKAPDNERVLKTLIGQLAAHSSGLIKKAGTKDAPSEHFGRLHNELVRLKVEAKALAKVPETTMDDLTNQFGLPIPECEVQNYFGQLTHVMSLPTKSTGFRLLAAAKCLRQGEFYDEFTQDQWEEVTSSACNQSDYFRTRPDEEAAAREKTRREARTRRRNKKKVAQSENPLQGPAPAVDNSIVPDEDAGTAESSAKRRRTNGAEAAPSGENPLPLPGNPKRVGEEGGESPNEGDDSETCVSGEEGVVEMLD